MSGIEAFFEEQEEGGEGFVDTESAEAEDNSLPEDTGDDVEVKDDGAASETGGEPEDKSAEGEAVSDKEPTPETETTSKEEPTPAVSEEQELISSQRKMLQELAQTNRVNSRKIDELTKLLAESGHIDEDALSDEDRVGVVDDTRSMHLEALAETMRVNSAYPGFDEICSEHNFNVVTDAIASELYEEQGGNLVDWQQTAVEWLWSQPNPYKYVYDLVKSVMAIDTPETDKQSQQKSVKVDTPPPSLSDVDGGNAPAVDGWTAKKIDSMDEEELHKVPAKVYEQYLSGELD